MDDMPLDAGAPHTCRLLQCCGSVRQFEFHPACADRMLAGTKDGAVAILDCEQDSKLQSLDMDTYPILGLSWLHTRPQWAVAGAAHSGTLCAIRVDDNPSDAMEHFQVEPFPHLSSLSVNCTDDFFMTSGFCTDLALYDMVTGRRLKLFRGLHDNYINILRFAHRTPHLFASASFDRTCKVWDLRRPIQEKRPVAVLHTDTLNVMCCFSPDDRRVLASGVDASLRQFHLGKQPECSGSRFPVPALRNDTNYRRSLYMADGVLVATAATNESILRLYTADEPHRHRGRICFGRLLVDARGVLVSNSTAGVVAPEGPTRRTRPLSTGPDAPPARMFSEQPTDESEGPAAASGWPVIGDDAEEYVQSLRCHPQDPTTLGALLSTTEPHSESRVAMVRVLHDATDF